MAVLIFAGCCSLCKLEGGTGLGQGGTQGGGNQTGGQQGGTGLGGMGYAQLVALGKPVQCTIRMTDKRGISSTTTLYLLGGMMRAETQIENETVVMISKNNVGYIKVDRGIYGDVECDWISISHTYANYSGWSQTISPEDLKNMPSTSFECVPAIFGNEKFETQGRVCTFEEIMQQMTNKYS